MVSIISQNAKPESLVKLLNEKEVAKIIQKSVHWLRRKRWEGGSYSIPYRKLAGSVRYAESDVLRWLDGCFVQTSTSQSMLNKQQNNEDHKSFCDEGESTELLYFENR